MSKISVILPALNIAKFLKKALTSVINQTLSDIEIIAVDGGSTDGTIDIIKSFAKNDQRICFISSDKKSYGYQMNLGISNAQGEYVAVLETDDYIEHTMYEKLYPIATENNLDVLWADYDLFFLNDDGAPIFQKICAWPENPENYNHLYVSKDIQSLKYDGWGFWRGIFRRAFLIDKGIVFNETPGAACQDIGFINRVLMHANRLMFVPESYYRYRTDRDGSSTNSGKGLFYSLQEHLFFIRNNELRHGYEAIFYRRMANSFLGILGALGVTPAYTEKIDLAWINENNNAYLWFMKTLRDAEKNGYFVEERAGYFWQTFHQLPSSLFEYAITRLNIKVWDFAKELLGKSIVLCGSNLNLLAELAKSLFLDIEALCTGEIIAGDLKSGFKVLSYEEAGTLSENVFVIADRKDPDMIKTRLLAAGINQSQIVFCPEEVLNPAISVILPVPNFNDLFQSSIQCLDKQKLKDLEIILVLPQNSNPVSYVFFHKYVSEDSRVKIINAVSGSYGAMLSDGIDAACGEYVAMIAPGDCMEEAMYHDLYKTAKTHDLDAVFCNYSTLIEKDGMQQQLWTSLMPDTQDLYEKLLIENELKITPFQFSAGSGIFRRNTFEEHDINFRDLQDPEVIELRFQYKLLMSAKRVMCNPNFYYTRIIRQESAASAKERLHTLYLEYRDINNALKKGFEKNFYAIMASGFCKSLDANFLEIDREWVAKNELTYQLLRTHLQEHGHYFDNQLRARISSMPDTLEDYVLRHYPASMRPFIKHDSFSGIILFGAGKRGAGLYANLPHSYANIDVFSDNNKSIWNTMINGLPVLPPAECVKKYPLHIYLITVKVHQEEIIGQLLSLGVRKNNIFTMDN